MRILREREREAVAAANIVFYDDGSGPQKGERDSLVSFLVDSDRACEVWLKGPEERERGGGARDKNMVPLRGTRPLEGPQATNNEL